jgi:hypothetical protein
MVYSLKNPIMDQKWAFRNPSRMWDGANKNLRRQARCAWLLANKRLDRRQDRLGHIILALLSAAIFIVANCVSTF